jgi:NADP-dependent aldehyde dehydrogenase
MIGAAGDLLQTTPPAAMLNPGILEAFQSGIARLSDIPGVRVLTSRTTPDSAGTKAGAAIAITDSRTFLNRPELGQEVFGPSTVVVSCRSKEDMEEVASRLEGQLTASIHGTAEDLVRHKPLISILENKAGRLIFNGFPTGVEVCPSMHHGGPYPATTDVRSTSVGIWAIKRFARPVCYQNFPQEALPLELQDINERQIWRLMENQWTKANVA